MTTTKEIYINRLGWCNLALRGLWCIIYNLFYRTSPRPLHIWRCWLLRLFGAKIGRYAHPYPGARIWAPWNLTLGDHSALADGVQCYSVAPIEIGDHVTISQEAFLCTATHDYHRPSFDLITRRIVIQDDAWIAARAFVGPGVTVGRGAVVAASAVVTRNVPPGHVQVGNPARTVRLRSPYALTDEETS